MGGLRGHRRRVAGALALAAATGAVASCSGSSGSGDAADKPAPVVAAEAFLAAWARGDDAGAAQLTDAPAEAAPLLEEVRRSLRVQSLAARLGPVTGTPSGQAAAYDATLVLGGLGDWSYAGTLPLVEVDAGGQRRWLVDWSPAVVHPKLTDDTALSRTRTLPPRASILDRDGDALTAQRPVVAVGVQPRRVTDAKRAYDALAKIDVDPRALAERVAAARPDDFVPAITLRREEFARHDRALRPIPGIVFRQQTRTLAPTAAFARGVLGTVALATQETLATAGPLAAASDDVGASGLQQAFQQQLAGAPGGQVRLTRRSAVEGAAQDAAARTAGEDAVVEVLHEIPARPGAPLRTTLDDRVQAAAEGAISSATKVTALVALRPSTGEVLAAANSASAGYNRAFTGRYPPGSTFKVVTTAALLQHGVTPATPVPCPETLTVEGKEFGNYEELPDRGDVPFRRAFVESCNTAFISAALPMPPAAVPDAAAQLGLGAAWDLGVETFSGSLTPAVAAVDRAAAALGQGTVLASPLGMAAVAGAVQSGTVRAPVLLPDRTAAAQPAQPAPPAQPSLPAHLAATLRTLMQETVAGGTGRVLRLPGPPVGAKTGTAQYGEDVPPREHAWIIGFRGDLAFAVLVEDGGRGSRAAGPVARSFLAALR